jgi:glycosyltransferase involved in cell wall biosynthesis
MRILYHHRTLGDGAEGIHISEMVTAFRKLGHKVLLVGPATDEVNSINATFSALSAVKRIFRGPFYELLELGYNIYGFKIMWRAIKNFHPDLIYDRYITFNYSCIAAGQMFKIPVFLEVNAPLAYERACESDERLFFKKLAMTLEKKICSKAVKTFVVSSPLKKYLISNGIQKKKIVVIPNGVNTQKFYPVDKTKDLLKNLSFLEDDVVIGFVGILRPWHGIDILLKGFEIVFKRIKKARLLIVGDGNIRKDIENQAKEMGFTTAMHITGRVPHKQIRNYIALFDIAVSPKATFYASPMKIPEYMALGKAVVAPDMDNIRDLLTDGINGLLFQKDNAVSLAEAILKIISNKKLKATLENSGRNETKLRLNWCANARHILNEFKN